MSNSNNQPSLEHHNQTVRQLYLDASLIEQTIQKHVEASKVGYRSSNSPHSATPSEKRLNLSDTSSTSQNQNQRRPSSVTSQNNQRRSGRQQQQQQQEPQGFQVPPSGHFRSNHEELTFLRDSLKDVYEVVLLEDLAAAVEKSVDERLWRFVFYSPIEELRAELRKLDRAEARRQEAMDELGKLLDKGTGFYLDLVTALKCEHDIDLTSVAVDVIQAELALSKAKSLGPVDPKSTPSRSRNGRGRQYSKSKDPSTSGPMYSIETLASSIQKCYIYLGDLARYRTNVRLEAQAMVAALESAKRRPPQLKPSASDWQAAYRFYTRAFQTFPDSGKPYGQLAILASYANDDLDALYWYTLSLGAKCPSLVVRDNLKVFFSRYQNRFKAQLQTIFPPSDNANQAVSTDDDEDTPRHTQPSKDQQEALLACDIEFMFIRIQMDIFAPQPESVMFHDSQYLDAFCHKFSACLAEGRDDIVQKMVISMILVIYDIQARTTLSSYTSELGSKEGVMAWKQAQRVGLTYLLGATTAVLDYQLLFLNQEGGQRGHRMQRLLLPTQCLVEFWMSNWDQIWGVIRLEEKWTGVSGRSELSVRKSAVGFFRSFAKLLNAIGPQDQERPSSEEISQKAVSLLQDDRCHYFGLMPFRRFQVQLTIVFDVVEDMEKTKLYRFMLFADKVIQASEGIRGTVVELSLEQASDDDQAEGNVLYKVMDADDKRLLRERGSKMLASHWLQDQVSSLQKGLESTERQSAQPNSREGSFSKRDSGRARPLVPISTLPGTVRLPLSGQTRLTDHYQRSAPKFIIPGAPSHHDRSGMERSSNTGNQSRIRQDKHAPPYWTCVVDFSVLVWQLSTLKTLLEHRKCLLIVPLDVIDRLDQAKKGQDVINQKTREAIRFLDDRLNITRWGMSEPLLVGQNYKDSLGRWSEAIPFLVQESTPEPAEVAAEDHTMPEAVKSEEEDNSDVVMTDSQSLTDPESGPGSPIMEESSRLGSTTAGSTMVVDEEPTKGQMRMIKGDGGSGNKRKERGDDTGNSEDGNDGQEEEREEKEKEEVRNAMSVPRVWRPILGACLFMLRKREETLRIPQERFILLTEDPDLMYYAQWFDIPTSNTSTWKHNGL